MRGQQTDNSDNFRQFRQFCRDVLNQLKQIHLDPLFKQLQGKEGAKMSFEKIIGGYNKIREYYHNVAIGAKDVIAASFFEFHPALLEEQEKCLSLLGQLKDYDEALTRKLAAKAYQEQEKQRLEEEQERLRQENLAIKKEMEMLGRKQNKEREKFLKQMDTELEAQKEQINNMKKANMERARKKREQLIKESENPNRRCLEMQKANEENIKLTEELSDLVDKQEEEKRCLDEEMKRSHAAREREELIAKMDARHKAEREKLRRVMEAKMKAHGETMAKQEAAAEARMAKMEQMQKKLDAIRKELEEVRKPFLMKAWSKAKEVGSKAKDKCSVM